MGRPRKTLPANGLQIISDLSRRGVKESDLARALGMGINAWLRIRDSDPAAKAAWQEARTIECDALVSSLFERALGHPAEFDGEGNLIRAEMQPDSWSAAFLLRTRHNYRDSGQTDAGSDQRVGVVINIPAAMSPDDYARLVQVTHAPRHEALEDAQ